MGWDEYDAQEELIINQQNFELLFTPPIGNNRIVYDINDRNHKPIGLRLDLQKITKYWNHIVEA